MFSVIMPVWDRAGTVGRAIESVLAQSHNQYELIIINDGSHDAFDDVVQPFLASGQIKVLKTSHQGPSAARNYGIRHALGEYIAYLDSDNRWHPEYLKRMNEAISGGGYDGAYCLARRLQIDPGGALVNDGVIGRDFSFQELLKKNYIDLNAFVHTRAIFERKGGFDERLKRLNDWDLMIRIAGWGEIKFVPETLVDYYDQVEKNAITNTEKYTKPLKIIRSKYRCPPGPAMLEHDKVGYTWDKLPDAKYRNYWRSQQDELISRIDYQPLFEPVILQIEPTNTCNLLCPLCPVSQKQLGRAPRHMRLDEFREIIDDVQDHVMLLIMWDWGEPFMNPELAGMIRYAAAKDIRTVTSTNAHFLNDEKLVEEILSSGLNTLIVAIDSLDSELYQRYRKKGSLEKAIAGLAKAIEIKRKIGSQTTINLRMVVMRQNEGEVRSLEKLAKRMGADAFTVKTVNPICGSEDRDSEFVPLDRRYHRLEYKPGTWERIKIETDCPRPWSMANIFSDGSVVSCCFDFSATMKAGNVFEESFREIWHGPGFAEVRRKILNEKNSIEHCARCLINFKYTPQGMFYRFVDFRRHESLLRKIYRHLPEPLQQLACAVLRRGKEAEGI
jgi:MoaA/NifB/PqqE/SkfB family radical SAM enzyme